MSFILISIIFQVFLNYLSYEQVNYNHLSIIFDCSKSIKYYQHEYFIDSN